MFLLYLGSIFTWDRTDIYRISVMSRHTLNDGVTPDIRIRGKYDEHRPILGPPSWLIGRYLRREIDFVEYRDEFRLYLQHPTVRAALRELLLVLQRRSIVLLCVEHIENGAQEFCHRFLVAEALKKLNPDLTVIPG